MTTEVRAKHESLLWTWILFAIRYLQPSVCQWEKCMRSEAGPHPERNKVAEVARWNYAPVSKSSMLTVSRTHAQNLVIGVAYNAEYALSVYGLRTPDRRAVNIFFLQ